jgi:hypothetical protein
MSLTPEKGKWFWMRSLGKTIFSESLILAPIEL